MAGDRARVSYDATRMWRGTVAQQGRVTVEADINEAAAIADERDRLTTLDVVGPVGTPDGGYTVTAFGSGASPPDTPGDLQIAPGTLYLGGERLHLDNAVTYSTQPDWLDHSTDPLWVAPAVPETDLSYELVFLRASEVEVSATEDPPLADVALGGPDTMQRRRILQRFMRQPVKAGDCYDAWQEYLGALAGQGLSFDAESMMLESTTSLQVSFTNTVAQPSLCEPVATGGYLGAENQLIRVMITSVDANGVPSIVWGFDDASFLYRLSAATYDTNANVTTITLASSPVDSYHFPALNQAVEVLRDAVELYNTGDAATSSYIASPAGVVYQLNAAYDPTTMQLTFTGELPQDYMASTPQLFLRVWEGTEAAPVNTTVTLGDTGLAVTLSSSGAAFNVGDFWLFAVRPINPAIVYPQRYLDAPQPPEGPRTWTCPLAVLTWQGGNPSASSCVPPFDNLVKLTTATGCGCTVNVGPADVDGGATLHTLISSLAGGDTVSVCLQPGTYTLSEPIVLSAGGFSAFTLRGCDRGVVLTAPSPPGSQFTLGLIVTQGTVNVTIEDVSLTIPQVAFTPSADAFTALPPANQQLMTAFSTGLQVAIGISSTDAAGMTIRRCDFNFGAGTTGNIFGAGIYATGLQTGFDLTDCSFSGSRQPDVAPFYDLTVGNQTQPPYQLLFGFLQVPSGDIGTIVGAGGLPQLDEAVIERCRFEGITVPALSVAQVGTVRIDENRVADCYGGFWLMSLISQSWMAWFDAIAVGNGQFFAYLSTFGLSALTDRVIAMATAMGRVLPTTPPSPVTTNIFRQIARPSRDVRSRVQRALTSFSARAAGAAQADAAEAGAAEAVNPFVVNPNAFFVGEAAVPIADPGTSVTMRLDVCDCQIDAVIADSYSGAGLLVVDLTGSRGSVLMHGCRVRNRFPLGQTMLAWVPTEVSVTGNIVANEVPTPGEVTFRTAVTCSIVIGAAAPYGVPAIVITGNVFISPTLLRPPRPATIPADLLNWDVLNTVLDFVAPPAVTSLSVNQGPAAGGTALTINGTGFTTATAVAFGSNSAAAFSIVSDTQINATSPAGSGTVDVVVTSPAGISATSPADQFSYIVIQSPVAGAAAEAAPPRGGTAPKTPRSTPKTPATGVTRPMQRPTPPGPESE